MICNTCAMPATTECTICKGHFCAICTELHRNMFRSYKETELMMVPIKKEEDIKNG
jgi:hypothetical protein